VNGREANRGQPLLVLATILGAWLIGRVLLWSPPFPLASPATTVLAFGGEDRDTIAPRDGRLTARVAHRAVPTASLSGEPASLVAPIVIPRLARRIEAPARDAAFGPSLAPTPVRRAAGHQMLLAAALANRALPPEFVRLGAEARGLATAMAIEPRGAVADRPLLGPARTPRETPARRLSGDAWLLWREGSADAVTPGISTYGRSQAGAVVRYRLLPGQHRQLGLYARATRTLEGARQSEVAAGLSLRPLPRLPVDVAAEARVTETATGRELRPAAFAVTQLPPAELPVGLRGEAYLQAGYVGGRFATAFVDGQARLDGRLARLGEGEEIRAGVATWGGAQKGAERLDVGPSASLAFRLGDVPSRIAVDYRLRVAGDASPASGPAVTFSAGF